MDKFGRVLFTGRTKMREPLADLLEVAGQVRARGADVALHGGIAELYTLADIAAKQLRVYKDETETGVGVKTGAETGVKTETEAGVKTEAESPFDLVFVLGGDGAFLEAARKFARTGALLAGINFGRVGFLTDIAREKMAESVGGILDGDYAVEERSMLNPEVRAGNGGGSGAQVPAVNDIVVSRGEGGVLLDLRVDINGKFAFNLRADGLIVSTPSGSTAYSLAAGGPIVAPDLDVVLLVPICPYALTHRPVVVKADGNFKVDLTMIKTPQAAALHIDGQESKPLTTGDVLSVRRHKTKMRICHPRSYDYYDTLRQKLNWGA